MKATNLHIINRVVVEVNVPNEKTANKLKNNISRFLQDELFPEIEALFNNYIIDEIIRFDRITLEVGQADWQQPSQLKRHIRQAFATQFEKQTGKVVAGEIVKSESPPLVERISQDEARFSTFVYFLENGSLPWFGKAEYWDEIQNEINWRNVWQNETRLALLRHLLSTNTLVLTRFVKQLPLAHILSFVEACGLIAITDLGGLTSYLARSQDTWKNQLLYYLLSRSNSGTERRLNQLIRVWLEKASLLQFKNLRGLQEVFRLEIALYIDAGCFARFFEADEFVWQQIVSEVDNNKPFQNPSEVNEEKKDRLESSAPYVGLPVSASPGSNPTLKVSGEVQPANVGSFFKEKSSEILFDDVGLILTIPFLLPLFRQLNLLDEANQLQQSSSELAVQILHYIATGAEESPEFQMLFEKFLCGVPFGFPLQRCTLLNNEIRQKCNEMLQELICQWPALKSTSPEGLRQLFLQRNGKLMETENSYRLVVERKAQDVLLEHLTWNLAVLQLPFSKQLLFTEW
ncbi:MAG: contractile injection system tape measure protein [Mangrovibacterium sp.]